MRTPLLLAALLLAALPVQLPAKTCPGCRSELPETANFCLTCGLQQPLPKPAPAAPRPQDAPPDDATAPSTGVSRHLPPAPEAPVDWSRLPPAAATPQKTASSNKDNLFRVFAPVDAFEKAIQSGSYSNIVGGAPQFRVTCGNALKKYNQAYPFLSAEVRLLGQMYLRKAETCETIVKAITTLRMDSILRTALLTYYGQILSWYNQPLAKARSLAVFSPQDAANLEAEYELIAIRSQKYQVTAKFLQIGKKSIPRGSALAVLEVRNGRALVLVLSEAPGDAPVQGWVSLASLQDRTTWKAGCASAFLKSPFSG